MSSGTVRPLAMACQYGIRAAHADFATVMLPDGLYAAGVAAAGDVLADETFSSFAALRRDAQHTLRTGKARLVNDNGDGRPTEAGVRVAS